MKELQTAVELAIKKNLTTHGWKSSGSGKYSHSDLPLTLQMTIKPARFGVDFSYDVKMTSTDPHDVRAWTYRFDGDGESGVHESEKAQIGRLIREFFNHTLHYTVEKFIQMREDNRRNQEERDKSSQRSTTSAKEYVVLMLVAAITYLGFQQMKRLISWIRRKNDEAAEELKAAWSEVKSKKKVTPKAKAHLRKVAAILSKRDSAKLKILVEKLK